ncbi:MAG: hypothetical protein ACI9CD_000854 [Candidatus Deianiraeaceae bacterium]|jgi:hypothetical protein
MNKENLPIIGLIIVAVAMAISAAISAAVSVVFVSRFVSQEMQKQSTNIVELNNNLSIKIAESNKDKSTATTPKWVHPYNHCLLIVTQKNPNLDLHEAKGMCSELLKNKGKV